MVSEENPTLAIVNGNYKLNGFDCGKLSKHLLELCSLKHAHVHRVDDHEVLLLLVLLILVQVIEHTLHVFKRLMRRELLISVPLVKLVLDKPL